MKETKRDAQRKRTHELLHEAALDVFRRVGVAAARIEEIAAQAGVSRASFYFHFPTKEHVLEEVRQKSSEALALSVRELPPESTLDELFATVARELNDRWEEDPKLLSEVALLNLRRITESSQRGEERRGARKEIAARFSVATANGQLRSEVPPEILTDLYIAQLFVVALGWTAHPEVALDQQLRMAGDLFLHGAGASRSAS